MALNVREVTVLLHVYDMPTSIRFYRDSLGCEVVCNSPAFGEDRFHWALLRLGGAEFMLNTAYEHDNERPPQPEVTRVSAHRDIVLYFACPDVDGAYHELQHRGVAVKPPTNTPYGMRQMYLHDPDGYQLCFQYRIDKIDK